MKAFTTIALLAFSSFCLGQNDVMSVLDSVIQRARQTFMYAASVNWDSLKRNVCAVAEGAGSIQELEPAFTTLLNGLGDKHGRILSAKDYSAIAYFTDFDNLNHPDKRIREPKIWEMVNDTTLKFKHEILAGRIGYLRIVGIAPNVDIEKEANKIRDVVTNLVASGVDKWIIDLRYNTGGNMHPMVSGIAPIIGDGKVGCLKNLNGEKLFDWEIKSSNFIYAGHQAMALPNEPKMKALPKVAVLTSRWTVSSGEVVATCFKGRPNTKFFGEMTGGFTTNNNWEIINGQVILCISTGIFCDRNEVAYEFNIPVDVELPFEVISDLEKDTCLIEASKWLKSN